MWHAVFNSFGLTSNGHLLQAVEWETIKIRNLELDGSDRKIAAILSFKRRKTFARNIDKQSVGNRRYIKKTD